MERIAKIKHIQKLLANKTGEFLSYENWSDEFCRKEIRELRDKIIAQLGRISLAGLTKEEAEELGFGKWSDESPLRLAPVWMYPFLTPGEELHSISGDSVVVGSNYTKHGEEGYVDSDHRFGSLAFGVMAA